MFETRKQLFEVLTKYIDEMETICATADADYDAAVREHARHIADMSFDEGDLAKEEDIVESIYDCMQDAELELDILRTFRNEMFCDWPALMHDNEEETENEH